MNAALVTMTLEFIQYAKRGWQGDAMVMLFVPEIVDAMAQNIYCPAPEQAIKKPHQGLFYGLQRLAGQVVIAAAAIKNDQVKIPPHAAGPG